jgi:hypothetical protein
LLQYMSLLLAQSGRAKTAAQCLISEVERTSQIAVTMSVDDHPGSGAMSGSSPKSAP